MTLTNDINDSVSEEYQTNYVIYENEEQQNKEIRCLKELENQYNDYIIL